MRHMAVTKRWWVLIIWQYSTDAFHLVPETSLLNGLRYIKRNFEKPGTEPAV